MFVLSEDAYSICEVGDAGLASDAVDDCWFADISESLAYLLTGAPVFGSSANVASEQHTSLGKVISTNSPGQIIVMVGGARYTRARLTACLFNDECVGPYV